MRLHSCTHHISMLIHSVLINGKPALRFREELHHDRQSLSGARISIYKLYAMPVMINKKEVHHYEK